MEKYKKTIWLQYVMTIGLIFTVFASSSMLVLAAPGEKTLAGEIIVSGNNQNDQKPSVMLNGERVFSGQTFFTSGVISTSETSFATVNLGKLGRINLSPNSILSLNFTENSISGNLSAGQIKVFTGENILVNIQTPDGTLKNDENQAGIYTIDVQSGLTKANAEEGSIYLNNESGTMPVSTGRKTGIGSNSVWIPVLIFAGIVGTAAIFTLTNGDNDNVTSPVR